MFVEPYFISDVIKRKPVCYRMQFDLRVDDPDAIFDLVNRGHIGRGKSDPNYALFRSQVRFQLKLTVLCT